MRVLGWMADQSACGSYRMRWPYEAAAQLGVDVLLSQTLSGEQMLEADLTVCQRVVTRDAVEVMEAVAEEGGVLAYEADDLLWGLPQCNPAFPIYGHVQTQRLMDRAVAACRGVIVSTEPLADAFLKRYPDKDVWVLPNRIPDYMVDVPAAREPRGSAVTIGWAGSPTHKDDMTKDAAYGLRRAMQSNTEARFVSMGADYRKALRVEGFHVPWDESIEDYHRSLAELDVGICPLELNAFNRCKSGIKALEYMAAGVVPVASRCSAYADIIEHGVTGFLCGTAVDWQKALRQLVCDHETREEMSAACIALTPSRTYSAHAEAWAETFAEIIG